MNSAEYWERTKEGMMAGIPKECAGLVESIVRVAFADGVIEGIERLTEKRLKAISESLLVGGNN